MTLKGTSIRAKLIRLIAIVSSVSLLLVFSVLFVYEIVSYRDDTIREMDVVANILAMNSTAALAFDDVESGHEILSAVKAERLITTARLYKSNGDIFTTFISDSLSVNVPARPGIDGFRIVAGDVEGFVPVMVQDKRLGTLFIRRSTADTQQRLIVYAAIAGSVILVSFFLTFSLSRRLQRTISDPLISLSDISSQVSAQHDYSVRAKEVGDGEVGQLTEAFNKMLSKIEIQNNEIQRHNHELESKIDERTKDYREANDQLQKRNADLEQFAYVASHDLQEPLRKVMLFSDRLGGLLKDQNEPIGIYLGKIDMAARRMSNLIRAVLSYSRLSQIEESFVSTDLNEIVLQIRVDLELSLDEKGAIINTDSLPVIKGNSLQLHQLFSNLIGNAIKFNDTKPVVTIKSSVEKGYARIDVIDNGIGFEQQYADKVFALFQRLHQDKKYAGTGIGLALCKKIVENHHGQITVVSEPGVGTTFTIILPIEPG